MTLTNVQKDEIKSLMTDYLKSGLFIYDGSFRRESYAYAKSVSSLNGSINGCMYKGKYILNCSLFAQMIWMGRDIKDFKSKPTLNITKAFDWGYYFNFTEAKKAYGITKANGSFYSGNTYTNDKGGTSFITFDNAAAMASELYRKGYEIPYSSVDIGDLVFYRGNHISDGSKDGLEQSSFRYITHVGIVYNVTEEGPTIIESSNAYKISIGKSGLGDDVTKFGNVRGADQEQRVVMAARHPAAFGVKCNVPNKFSVYRGIDI